MYKPATLRISSIVAMILSALGLLIGIALTPQSPSFALSTISWAILLWAAYLGFRLAGYKLHEDEYKKVSIRIYLIIIAFILFMFIGVAVGLFLSVALLATLWGLKKNYDEWQSIPADEEIEAGLQ